MVYEINDEWLIMWSVKWDLLTKMQKNLICLLKDSPKVGNFSDIVKFCGINANNMTANMKQIKRLEDWGIITISDFNKNDTDDIKHQIVVSINSRTKIFRLCKNWVNKINELSNEKIVEMRRK